MSRVHVSSLDPKDRPSRLLELLKPDTGPPRSECIPVFTDVAPCHASHVATFSVTPPVIPIIFFCPVWLSLSCGLRP